MPGGKETRLLHLSEMEKLDKTLFRLEQGRSGPAQVQTMKLKLFLETFFNDATICTAHEILWVLLLCVTDLGI
uniref:Uncharacterized protein n=1 Tax=Amazona collaria TaxID=241587 RepID=A0A8B9FBV7_9PSIT